MDELGQGGMGTVYRALDTHLDRYIALKVLRSDIKVDTQARARFTQEAKAASALNHPNIVHIYDVGEENGVDYIAMEYVAGTTLDPLLTGLPLPIDQTLNYSIQIADALGAAHSAGIVHRDLKPGNVMVNERGLVKVLDFGLAKLTERTPSAGDISGAPTLPISPQTIAGQTVGTPSYMSPEQAEGREIDARSDIFSFGIMLYQMFTGVLPFTGSSAFSVLASVLRDEPKPVAEAAPGISPQLAEVVTRCLRKDPNLRYQSIEDAKNALEGERRQRTMELAGERAGSVRISSVQQLAMLSAPPRRRIPLEAIAAAVILIVAGCLWYAFNRHPAKPTDNTPVRLTSDEGLDTTPAISPDGKLLAYASDRSGEGTLDLWVMQIGSNAQPLRRTKEGADATSPVFSPDGTKIAFRSERNGGAIYITPALTGEEKFIAAEGRRPQFSPDGGKIVYYTAPRSNTNATRPDWGKMFIVDLSSGGPRPVRADFAAAINPLFTPDGNHLLFIGTRTPDAKQSSHWWVTPLDGGEPVDTGFEASVSGSTDQYRLQIPVAWHGDRVIYSRSDSNAADVREIEISPRDWKVSGEPRKLTFGTTHDEYPSFSSDGRLVFASLASNIDIYALPMKTNTGELTGELRRVTKTASVDSVRDISADGRRLVFLTDRTGHPEVWSHDFDTGAEKQLSDSPAAKRQPVITRDGQTVAFADDVEGRATSIYAVPFAGGPARRVCERCGAQSGWAPDGKHLLVTDYARARNPILDLDVDTGQTREVLRHPQYSLFPRSFSPDGKWISLSADRGAAGIPIAIAPYRPGNPPPESEWIFLADGKSQDLYPRWSPDGNTIYFVSDRDGHIAILSQRLDPQNKHPLGKPTTLYVFSSSLRFPENMLWISVAQDKIVFSLEERTGSIWMLRP